MVDVKPGMRKMPNLPPLTAKQIRDAEHDKVYIFNVSPREHRVMVEKLYIIPARKADGEVSDALVIPGMVYTTQLKKSDGMYVEFEWVGREGTEIAREIVGTSAFRHQSENLLPFGVFVSNSPIPTEAEVNKARSAWLEKCSEKVAEADMLASVNNGVVDLGGGRTASNIGKDHREALKEIGQQRSWSGLNERMIQCPECNTPNMPAAARCKNNDCRCIFDETKCRQRFPEMFAHEVAEKRGPGRPRSEAA